VTLCSSVGVYWRLGGTYCLHLQVRRVSKEGNQKEANTKEKSFKTEIMKCTVFWDVTLCSSGEVYWRFGGTYCLHLQGQRVSKYGNWKEASSEEKPFTTEIMKSPMFWDVTLCSSVKVHWRFGGTYCLHLQGRRVSQAVNWKERSRKQRLLPVVTMKNPIIWNVIPGSGSEIYRHALFSGYLLILLSTLKMEATLLWIVSKLLTDCMVSYTRR
jgi:hypothetical protein